MKKLNHLKFHFFSYRFIILTFWGLLIIFGLIWTLIQPTKTLFYALISLFILALAVLGMYEKKENVNIFLNININRQAYLLCDVFNVLVICLFNTLMLLGGYYLFTSLKLIELNIPQIFFGYFFLAQILINRIFYLLTIYVNKLSFGILISLLFVFLLFEPLKSIEYLIYFSKISLLLSVLIIGILLSELLIILVINKKNLIFKKSLS